MSLWLGEVWEGFLSETRGVKLPSVRRNLALPTLLRPRLYSVGPIALKYHFPPRETEAQRVGEPASLLGVSRSRFGPSVQASSGGEFAGSRSSTFTSSLGILDGGRLVMGGGFGTTGSGIHEQGGGASRVTSRGGCLSLHPIDTLPFFIHQPFLFSPCSSSHFKAT